MLFQSALCDCWCPPHHQQIAHHPHSKKVKDITNNNGNGPRPHLHSHYCQSVTLAAHGNNPNGKFYSVVCIGLLCDIYPLLFLLHRLLSFKFYYDTMTGWISGFFPRFLQVGLLVCFGYALELAGDVSIIFVAILF